jgi:hypothetical protein
MAITRTTTYTVSYARVALLELQISAILELAGVVDSAKSAIREGIQNRWIENISLHWINSRNLVEVELSLNIDWGKYNLHLAAGRESVDISTRREPDAVSLDGTIEMILDWARDRDLRVVPTIRYAVGTDVETANQILGLTPVAPVRWLSGAIGTVAPLPRLDEITAPIRLAGISPSRSADAATGSSEWADETDKGTEFYTGDDRTGAVSQSKPPAELQVEVYLDTEDRRDAEQAFRAVDELVDLLGYERPDVLGDFPGSIFRRMQALSKEALTSKELRDRLIKVERAVELNYLDTKQAEVDGKEAEAVSKLVGALENVPEACVRLGSILLIKYQISTGPIIVTRNLSQVELRALERFPEIQTKPSNVLSGLATAVASLESNKID